jgi:hypothetical protein
MRDIIEEVLKENPKIKWQRCTKCNIFFPYCETFFRKNLHSSKGLNTYCKDCEIDISITHPNHELNNIYKTYGEDCYLAFKDHNTIKIFQWHLETNQKYIPKIIHNKNDYLLIIKYLFDNDMIDKDKFTLKEIMKSFNITSLEHLISVNDVYNLLFGDDFRIHPWKYPVVKLYDLTFDESKTIFNSYLRENNIIINDIYSFNYTDILRKCRLMKYINGDILEFIMKYYNNEYAAYKFKGGYEHYWKIKNNANQALKYFIEKDMKIPIDKIPLYITLNVLQQKARTLYNLIHSKRFHNTLYEWINDIYPGIFIEADFHIGVIRNKFDSVEEEQIYNLLKDEFGNVIYNKRNTDNTIKFNGMIPDYLIFDNKECIIGEYFGLYAPDRMGKSKRIKDYIKKTDDKIVKYKNVNYKKLFMFPSDLNNNMEGIKEKIHNFKN